MKAPKHIKEPVLTTRGWVDGKTGELVKAMKVSQAAVDAWSGKKAAPTAPTKVAAPVVEKVEEVVEEVVEEQEEKADNWDEDGDGKISSFEELKKKFSS